MEIIENKEICSNCGGKCCKKSGCDYTVDDFDNLSFNYLYELLQEGNISIVSTLKITITANDKEWITPFLYLRSRNINRPIVDLLSLKTTCSQLLENGCRYTYQERPSGGKNLIPSPNYDCRHNINQRELLKEWERYQKVLSRLVKRISGMSVDQRLRLDVENLLLDLFNQNFENVSAIEIQEICGMVPHLTKAFPEESLRAKQKYEENPKVKSKNKLSR